MLGLGLALKLGGVARIELNYCVPVKVIILNTFNSKILTVPLFKKMRDMMVFLQDYYF